MYGSEYKVIPKKENIFLSIYRYLDAFIRDYKDKPIRYEYNLNCQSKKCIILDKGMGDFILFARYLKGYIDYYKEDLYIIADTYNVEFLKLYVPNAANVIILKSGHMELTNGDLLVSLRGNFKKAIVPINAISPRTAEILRILSPNKIISMGNELFLRKYSITDYSLFKNIENSGVETDFYCKMHRAFLFRLTGLDKGLAVDEPLIPERIISEDYFVVNISASNKVHLPDLNLFITAARILSDAYGFKAVLIGDCSESDKEKIFKIGLDISYLNLRNMNKTVSLCNYSQFVITTDTGIFHLAMSLTKDFPVFVVTWGYSNVLFEPYPEELSRGRLHFIQLVASCSVCPYSKSRCWFNMRFKNTVQCVKNLTSERVIDDIKKSLKTI